MELQQNQALVYKNLVYKVRKKIKNIDSLGVNTSKYNEFLKQIIDRIENEEEINSKKIRSIADNFLVKDYSEAIRDLESLIELLDKFEIYIKAFNKANYVELQLGKENIYDNVNLLVDEMLEVLKQINTNIGYFSDMDKIDEKIFSIVYELIKVEIIVSGKSRLYDYLKVDNKYLYFMDNYVNQDIEKLDLTEDKYSKIRERKYQLDSEDSEQSYFDLEMIRLLLTYDNNIFVKNDIYNRLNIILGEINDLNSNFFKLKRSLSNVENSRNEVKDYLKSIKEDLLKLITPTLLVISIIVGIGAAIPKLLKKINTHDTYKNKITTYSDWQGINSSEENIRIENVSDYDNKVYLNLYGLWEKQNDGLYDREIRVYDVSNFKFDNIEDYLNYGLENYDVDYVLNEEFNKSIDEIGQLYTNEYLEVEMNDVDTTSIESYFELNNFGYGCLIILSYFVYLLILISIDLGIYEKTYFNVLDVFPEILDDFKFYLKKKKSNAEQVAKLNNIVSELSKIVNSNKKLKLEFNRLYKEKKYLLEDPERLYKEFENLSNDISLNKIKTEDSVVKKLIKEKQ